jgi:hypothetical protein
MQISYVEINHLTPDPGCQSEIASLAEIPADPPASDCKSSAHRKWPRAELQLDHF